MKEKNTIKIKRNELAETVFATLCSDPPVIGLLYKTL